MFGKCVVDIIDNMFPFKINELYKFKFTNTVSKISIFISLVASLLLSYMSNSHYILFMINFPFTSSLKVNYIYVFLFTYRGVYSYLTLVYNYRHLFMSNYMLNNYIGNNCVICIMRVNNLTVNTNTKLTKR